MALMTTAGGIVVERLGDARYRAHSPMYPDCEAIAATAEEARQAVEAAIARILRESEEWRASTSAERESP
jgi:hypothetical protein